MGCDIHLHQEVKIDGVWHHYRSVDQPRNYSLFAKMAGVRGEETPIVLPKGMPQDATLLTHFDCDRWKGCAHSYSWLNAEEISKLQKWAYDVADCDKIWRFELDNWGYFFGNTWGGFHDFPEERPKGVEDVRFIFWFDNPVMRLGG